jgi:response regulator RpfG family c-di-GMP phosphodiesterase
MQSYVLMMQTDEDDRDITESILSGIELAMPVKFIDSIHDFEVLAVAEGIPVLILINESSARHASIEIVKRLKNNPVYRHIPLVILAERSLVDYIKEYYAAGASTFIVKPSTIELTRKKIEGFFTYWFQIAELPTEAAVENN